MANFSAVHLRIESDWVLDPKQDLLAPYFREMLFAGFSNSTPCYFASAVFDYKSERGKCRAAGRQAAAASAWRTCFGMLDVGLTCCRRVPMYGACLPGTIHVHLFLTASLPDQAPCPCLPILL